MADRIRHMVKINEQRLLDWLKDQYRPQRRAQSVFDTPIGAVIPPEHELSFDPERSAIIGTSFSAHDELSFMVVEIPKAKHPPKLRTVVDDPRVARMREHLEAISTYRGDGSLGDWLEDLRQILEIS